ncbi:hypothetical protein BS636_02710 [Acinetobacter sp. LoGeW2-3]|uniref:hypothetical protein n=1 Tax=Acinetobacter sp. LoGeW2-3 TaxID=1808001 RepID=UPI000C05BAE1|nr:hypothetical protein [Acinetobacter sp. LoGeW2-3]ATO18649.1 hypothetical protein BS636_02710 [Acinetobacter sp. LoGeW2-3]
MNIKQRIHRYTPQPVTRPVAALAALLLCSGGLFALGCVLAWQGILFHPLEQYWILLLLISFILVLSVSYDWKQYFKFPFLIQQYLIDSKLAQDIRERALRSSDATIMGQRQIHTTRLHKQQQLLLKLNDHETPQWFNVDLNQVFNTEPYLDIHVRPSDALIGQQVLVYYLMRTRWIVQLYAYDGDQNFQHLQHYIATPIRGRIYFDHIPSRLMLDLPRVAHIQASREDDSPSYTLKLSTNYGKYYRVSCKAAHFDKLELALANLIDFLRYRDFKHHPEIRQAVISKHHPFLYRNLLNYMLIAALLLFAATTADWQLALLSLVVACLRGMSIQQHKQSPFIEA